MNENKVEVDGGTDDLRKKRERETVRRLPGRAEGIKTLKKGWCAWVHCLPIELI
jgi:hypothetical protein